MKADDLLDIIGEADDRFVEGLKQESQATVKSKSPKSPNFKKWACAAAACLVLAISAGIILPHLGGSNSGSAGHDEGSVFMSYAGPIFPLTLLSENEYISAQRDITMDFAPFVPTWISNEDAADQISNLTEEERQEVLKDYSSIYPEGGRYSASSDIEVTDSYILTNSDNTDKTVKVLYPFASSLNDLEKTLPILTAGGETASAGLYAGAHAQNSDGRLRSWEGYNSLLSDGSYIQTALADFVDLSNIPVTVYKLTDAWAPEADESAGITNPTLRIMFNMDYDKTRVLSYGFNGSLYDIEEGVMGRLFSIREEGELGYGEPYYLIVMGDDIENLEYQGYATGGWDAEKTIEAGVTITRTETNLEEALREAAQYKFKANDSEDSDSDFELLFGLLKTDLVEYGLLDFTQEQAGGYLSENLEGLNTAGVTRVFWLEAEITIPAGESVTVAAKFTKEASYDFHCTASKNEDINGYDMVTELGSNLSITRQTAHLEDRGQIEIVRQNFGFDIQNGVKQVELDLSEPHYYLEVKAVKSDR